MTLPDSPSEAVAAARLKFQEITTTAASRLESCAEQAAAADKKAKEANQEFTDKVQKIEKRVRELIDRRITEQQPKRGIDEIEVGSEEPDEPDDEVAVEYRDLIENFPIPQPDGTSPQSATSTQPAAASQDTTGVDRSSQTSAAGTAAPQPNTDPSWNVRAGRFGQPQQESVPEAPRSPAPEPNNAWNVQAGRFGRRKAQPTPPPEPPKQAPKPAPKPEPRRSPAYDEDDFENQSWLR
jgi:hypothetical protein